MMHLHGVGEKVKQQQCRWVQTTAVLLGSDNNNNKYKADGPAGRTCAVSCTGTRAWALHIVAETPTRQPTAARPPKVTGLNLTEA